MGPIFRFLSSLRSLAKSRNITIEDAYKFAQQEFGEVNELLKLQINKIFKDVKAPSIKKPSKPEGKVIETSFKPGVDKTGKVVEESPSQLMKKLETGIKSLQKENISTGLTRTLAREILMKRGIDLGKGMDPIEIFRSKFGEEILGDVANLADELVEMEAMGKTPKRLEDILKQEGLLDVKMPKEPPRGYSDEELKAIQKEIDQEDILLKFDPKDREPNATGGRVGLAMGSLPKGIQALVKQINKKFGKDTMKTADEMERPESAKLKEMFEDFEKRTERKILDVPEVPKGFKTSKEKLMQQFPEIDEDFAEQMMQMDKDLLGRTIMMLKDRRRNPELYDELLEKYGDTLEFQGEFDKAVRRKQNAGGGLAYLMGL